MKINRQGTTRVVFLTKKYAFKVPNYYNGWELFLRGLLSNLQEIKWDKCKFDGLCPLIFSLPGGWLNVMPNICIMSREEFDSFNTDLFIYRKEYDLPVEPKFNSFGYLKGKIVAVDYGG